jgi:hypothetical protein
MVGACIYRCYYFLIGKPPNKTKGKKMAKTATGSKSGLEAFNVLMQWREDGAPEFITSYEAWNLTGGIVGRSLDATAMRLIEVAVKYTIKGGSVKDYLALKGGN